MALPQVDFSVNVCNSDAPFLDATLRHMIRSLNYPFSENLLAYDPGKQDGKHTSRIQGDRQAMETIRQRLLDDRMVGRVDVIPWSAEDQGRILTKYSGTDSVDMKDFSGAPNYQFLYALDQCECPYVFQADSDMLFHRSGPQSWIGDGIALLQSESKVVVTYPRAGPPQARNWLEKLTERSFEAAPTQKWPRVEFTSTRYLLLDIRTEGDVIGQWLCAQRQDGRAGN